MAQLNHNIGSKGVNTPDLLLLGQQDHHRPRRDEPRAERPDHRRHPVDLPARAARSTATRRGHPVFWGGGGYATLWNEAPFRNNQDLFVLKDDYSAVFGKHLFKAGVLASYEQEERGLDRQRLRRRTRRSGASAGLNGWGANTGQHPRRLPAQGHDLRLLRARPASARSRSAGSDLEFYVHDSWKVKPARDPRLSALRWSLLYNYYAERRHASRASTRRSSTRRSATTPATAC